MPYDIHHIPPISVSDGDITPITHTPIELVDASEWSKLSVNDLYKQKSILQTRHQYSAFQDKQDMCLQIQRGIDSLQNYINERMDKEGNSLI